jgi:hypothetical protein
MASKPKEAGADLNQVKTGSGFTPTRGLGHYRTLLPTAATNLHLTGPSRPDAGLIKQY